MQSQVESSTHACIHCLYSLIAFLHILNAYYVDSEFAIATPFPADESAGTVPANHTLFDQETTLLIMKSGKNVSTADPSPTSKLDGRLALFDHLPKKQLQRNPDLAEGDRIIHPATIKLGSLYSKGIIQSDDDRVTSLVAAFCNIIQDYKTPPKKALREDLDKYVSKQVSGAIVHGLIELSARYNNAYVILFCRSSILWNVVN